MSDEAVRPTLKTIAPQFVVPDVVRAAEYYRDILGFAIVGYFWEPPVYAIVQRDGVELHFGRQDGERSGGNRAVRCDGVDAYVRVTAVDALADEFRARGADVLEGPVTRGYGMREMLVRDRDGFVIAFGA